MCTSLPSIPPLSTLSTLSLFLSFSLSPSHTIVSFKCFVVYIIISVYFIYLGQGPSAPGRSQATHLYCFSLRCSHGAQDCYINSVFWGFATRRYAEKSSSRTQEKNRGDPRQRSYGVRVCGYIDCCTGTVMHVLTLIQHVLTFTNRPEMLRITTGTHK